MTNQAIKFYLLLAVIFYIVASFINLNFNPIAWSEGTRVYYSLGAIVSLFLIWANDN